MKLNVNLSYVSANPPLGIYSRIIEIYFYKKIYISVHDNFGIVKTWEKFQMFIIQRKDGVVSIYTI